MTTKKRSPRGLNDLIARRIKEERLKRHWTFAALKDQLDQTGVVLAPSTFWKNENGHRKITIDELVAYAEVFEVRVTDLLEEQLSLF